MDKRYEVFCLADRFFYERPEYGAASARGRESLFAAAERAVPEGWRSVRHRDWLQLRPVDAESAAQGWKVHVSATLDSAEKTAARVWDYCVPRGLPFKFIPSARLLHLRNSKYAPRGSSGKFVTVYPGDEARLETVLRELGELLDGEPGPYILSDLRWNNGPLYVRYGGFALRHCLDAAGELVPAIQDPSGELVPDRRDPSFRLPEWVKLPAFLEPQVAARNATTTEELPYRVESALHFSNGGGVYLGRDLRSGDRVVLKEARPYAGLASDGADAPTRLEREMDALERLSGLGVAPEVRDWFTLGGHRFLVMDFLPGRTLNSCFAERHPLLAARPDPEGLAGYTRWAMRVCDGVERAVAAVHSRGVVFNDLHLFNVMVDGDGESVFLLDFEAAAPVDRGQRQSLAHPGFVAPAELRGFDVDRYALACLRLALFLPLTQLLAMDRGKAAHLAEVAASEFPTPDGYFDEAVRIIDGRTIDGRLVDGRGSSTSEASGRGRRPDAGARPAPVVDPADWPRSRDSMVAAILASATPDRDDRLYPGDIDQFGEGGGLGLANGAAGVLYALAETGAPRHEAGEEWLLRHTDPGRIPVGTPLGLYDGLLGTAYVLERLGHRQRALDLTERVLAERWQQLGSGLEGGLAGIGLVLDHLAERTGESVLRERAAEAAGLLAQRLRDDPPTRAGLLNGATGPALLFLRMYERRADPALLDLAAAALHLDLARCVRNSYDALVVDEGFRTMPYLGAGSAGIAMVLDDYLTHRQDPGFEAARAAALPAAHARFYAQSGLFAGRAGLVLHLGRTSAPTAVRADLDAQIAALSWHAMDFRGHLAFPGDQIMRLSMDLATGTAGVLLALGAALHGEPVGLPFLPPLPPPP
uniref:class III lanthionine synthetase LanKC n=1 Tax=Streptacidiphilus carbonis TaxID=105422 RepID=UPI0005A9B6EE